VCMLASAVLYYTGRRKAHWNQTPQADSGVDC